MQHPFGALTRNFRLIRLRKFRGQQPAGPAGDGKTPVALAKCLMSLNGHLLRPVGTSPPCFSFTRFIVEQCLLKKTKYMTPANSLKTTRSSHSAQYRRHQTYSDALKNSFSPELFHIGIVCLLLWQMPSPQRSLGHSLFKQKFSQKFLCFFVLFFFFVCFLFFYFIKISKFALPGVMLMYERTSKERKKERKKV